MFIDKTTVELWGGDGGSGTVSFRREKFIPKGGPDGGDGGDGGNCMFIVNPNLRTLADIRYHSIYKADRGDPGGKNNRHGKNGESREVSVPPGTTIKMKNSDDVLADLVEDGETFIACRGGRGGKGNSHFKSSQNRSPRKAQPGEKGEKGIFQIELKILADVGLVGLPNAGKSTLLSVLSNANPKIANYPFTTVNPNLGLVKFSEFKSFVMADIPGLIKGAGMGKGLGHQFLKHIERTRVLVFLIDVNDPDPNESLTILTNEIENYNLDILKKPRIIVLTKSDTLAQKNQPDLPDYPKISSISGDGLKSLVNSISEYLDE
jgi:GTP-binding protein